MNARPTRLVSSAAGFTILEVLVAALMLGIGLVGILALQATATVANRRAVETRAAMQIAQTTLERAKVDALEWTTGVAPQATTTLGQVLASAPVIEGSGAGSGSSLADYASDEGWTLRQIGGKLVTQNVMNLPNVDGVTLPGGERPRALEIGADYCVATRAFPVVNNEVVRIDVRVFWAKNTEGAVLLADDCSWIPANASEERFDQLFYSVWLSGTVRRNDLTAAPLLPPAT